VWRVYIPAVTMETMNTNFASYCHWCKNHLHTQIISGRAAMKSKVGLKGDEISIK
jgi:hypothetical protein